MRTSFQRLGLAILAALVTLAGAQFARASRPAPTDRAQIRATLAARRAAALVRLHAYAPLGRFPHDYDVAPALHVFRDDAGRLCAVANLVHLDGRNDLVDAVAAARNDLAVADVHDGPLYDWILGSGFTQEELARIQKPAPYVERLPAPRPPDPVADGRPAPMSEDQMNAAMLAHLATVEAELHAGTAASLDTAVDRYLAHRSRTVRD